MRGAPAGAALYSRSARASVAPPPHLRRDQPVRVGLGRTTGGALDRSARNRPHLLQRACCARRAGVDRRRVRRAIRRRRFAPRPAERRARRAHGARLRRSTPPTTSDGRSRRSRAAPISLFSSACVTFSPRASAPGGPQPPTRRRTCRPPGRFAPPAAASRALRAGIAPSFVAEASSSRFAARRRLPRTPGARQARRRERRAASLRRVRTTLVAGADFRDSPTMIALGVDCGTSGLKAVLVGSEGSRRSPRRRARIAPIIRGRCGPSRIPRSGSRRCSPRSAISSAPRRDAFAAVAGDRLFRPDARRGAARRATASRCGRRSCTTTGAPSRGGANSAGTPSAARRRRRRQADGGLRRAEADVACAP